MPMGQTLFNSMENVVVRPTQDQITNATSILTIGDTSDSTCTVCQEQIDHDVPVRRINLCQHQFHKSCIDRWFERSVFCPMCRQDIRDSRAQQGGTGTTE
jgi:protoheme ferro-lyase